MKDEIIVLSVSSYDFTQDDGKQVNGCKVMYIPAGSLKPVETVGSNVLGLEPCKETFPLDFFNRAKEVGIPCKAEVQYAMRQNQGKQVLKIVGLDFLPEKESK